MGKLLNMYEMGPMILVWAYHNHQASMINVKPLEQCLAYSVNNCLINNSYYHSFIQSVIFTIINWVLPLSQAVFQAPGAQQWISESLAFQWAYQATAEAHDDLVNT